MLSNDEVKAPTAFTIIESSLSSGNTAGDTAEQMLMDDTASSEAEPVLLPDRLRKRLQSKCRPTNEQLDLKLARAEQRRQKQFAKRAASAREADARCRRVAEAMEALVSRRPESRAQVMERFARLQRDLHTVLGRFNSEVEQTNCALFAGAPLLAFGGGFVASPMLQQQQQQQQQAQLQQGRRIGQATAFVAGVAPEDGNGSPFQLTTPTDLPARLKQRLAAYPRRRGRHELKMALEKKLVDAQRRKERYEQRRADSIRETEERCRRISETMSEISLGEADQQSATSDPGDAAASGCTASANAVNSSAFPKASSSVCRNNSTGSSRFYRRVANLQVDLDCLFTKFNREIVTVRGRPVDLLESLQQQQQQQQRQNQSDAVKTAVSSGVSIGCQTESFTCQCCGGAP